MPAGRAREKPPAACNPRAPIVRPSQRPHTPSACLQVNYKNVMQQYSLGPNGGILTSLNLFATRFDQASKQASKEAGCLVGAALLPTLPV